MPKNIVWTAVVAAGASVASVVFALAGASDLSIALGFSAVAAGLLSTRER